MVYVVFNVFVGRVKFLRRYIGGYSFTLLAITYVFLSGG